MPGAVTGGLLGSAAAGWHLPVPLHLSLVAGAGTVIATVAYRRLLSDTGDDAPPAASSSTPSVRRPRRAATIRAVLALGAVGARGAVIQDAAAAWSAIYLTGIGATAALAGLGYVALQAAMTAGRLVAARCGHRSIAQASCLTTAVAMTIALTAASPPRPG